MRRLNIPRQSVNLLSQSTVENTNVAWGFKSFVTLFIIGSAVLMLSYVATLWTISDLQSDQKIAANNLHERQQQLAALKLKIPALEGDPFIKAELQRLQLSQRKLQKIIRLISQQSKESEVGFADYFRGLARRKLDGLWLDDIRVSSAGELTLKGKTLEAALVPRLLQSLIEEPVFAGRSFQSVRFIREKKTSDAPLMFELESKVAEDDADAG